jgi:transcription initiation factor TFIIIB Brf1 subunit/transcription initiation factor TFIIB
VDENKFHLSHLALCDNLDIEPHTSAPPDYAPFLQAELGLTDTAQNQLEHFLSPITEKQAFVGKDPAGIAAGGVYVLLDDFTQGEVAEAAGVSTETVRQRVNQLRGFAEDD